MRYGCKNGMPHDLKTVGENPQQKWEVCVLCNRKFKFNKGYKSRVDNKRYLEIHVRNFAQSWGRTKRIYHKIYRPLECVIEL